MNAYRSRPNRIPWPPILLVMSAIAAFGLGQVYPLPASFAFSPLLGALCLAAALGLDIWAMKTLHDGKTTILPNRGSSHLVTGGPFRFSRNPIYVANVVLLVGAGLASGNGWFLALAPVAAILTEILAIRREENHLVALFGYTYEVYRRKVRRWI